MVGKEKVLKKGLKNS